MTNEFRRMREELTEKAEREAMKLWRLARTAQARGVSMTLVSQIRAEADDLYTNYTTYPERLLSWDTEYKFKYAFK